MGIVVAIVGFFSSFPIVLNGLKSVGASDEQAAAGLMFAALSMGAAGIILSYRSKVPVSVAWSTPGAALLAVTPPDQAGFAGAIAGFVVAGALTVVAGLWRPLGRLAAAVPPVLAQGMLAGVLLPICIVPFRGLAEAPEIAGPILLVWFIAGRINRLLAMPAAVIAAVVIILVQSGGSVPFQGAVIASPVLVMPAFSLGAIVGIGLPLFVVTMATQNVPGIAVLRSLGYQPEPGPMLTTVGVFSVLSAPFGAPATCLAALTAAMCAGEDCDPDPRRRYWSAIVAGVFYCVFGVFAGFVTVFAALGPPLILATLAGVGLFGVFVSSVRGAFSIDEDREAAGLTMVITASGVTLFGLGGAVWGLVIGGAVYGLSKWSAR